MSAELQIVLGIAGFCSVAAAASVLVRNYRRKWVLVSIKGDFTVEHHLPETIPVPRQHASRVREDDFTFDEAVAWMRQFVKERKRHKLRDEYQRVVSKYEVYRHMAEKMGRGLWREVFALGQRLAEIDPLDPSASVARGRALRELGNYPGAIRYYQQALDLTPFHSAAFPEMASTCRMIGQPGRFRPALEKAKQELGNTHPLIIEGRIQLGELVRVYADPTDPATVAHIPREQYLQNLWARIEESPLDPANALGIGRSMLNDDTPELADAVAERCERDYGQSAEMKLLRGLIEQYRLNLDAAERRLREAVDTEDTAVGRYELGRLLAEKAARMEDSIVRADLEQAAQQELRLAVDRDPDMVDAVGMLLAPAWNKGLEKVLEAAESLRKAYPKSWAIWRVVGDAYLNENQVRSAIESYRKGLTIEKADELLLPCLSAMEQANAKQEMLELVRELGELRDRDSHLRWRAAQVFCEHQCLKEARKVLQEMVDDDHVAPQLRQRANEVLDQLDEIERQQSKQKGKKR